MKLKPGDKLSHYEVIEGVGAEQLTEMLAWLDRYLGPVKESL